MRKVEMLVPTGRDGKKVNKGDVLRVDDLTASRWVKQGIAQDMKSQPDSKPGRGKDEKPKKAINKPQFKQDKDEF